jgi:anti-sigma B factor antagonist
MSANANTHRQTDLAALVPALGLADESEEMECCAAVAGGRSRLRLQVIEPLAIVRFAASDFLVGEPVAREVIGELEQLAKAEGYSRLLLNFTGVRYLSSEMLAALVGFGKAMDQRGGRVQLCGLDPLMRDLFRTTHLDHIFDIAGDEAEALGILIR